MMRAVVSVEDAASSNADWCHAFCRTHGVSGRFDETAWSSAERIPPTYSDAVTLVSGCSAEGLVSRVDVSSGCSIKDSFADLALAGLGFEVLSPPRGCASTEVAPAWGGMPVVGYEKGESLEAAQRAGFEAIGGLAVWIKAEAS